MGQHMQSFIVLHHQQEARDAHITSLLTQQAISPFDRTHVTAELSIGIETIRIMQKSLFLKSVQGTQKAIIIDNAQELTIEAQNALLKVLEEPPAHVLFFLSTPTTETLLPTILSRCSIIALPEKEQQLTDKEQQGIEEDLQLLFSKSIATRLALAEKIASSKSDAPTWVAKSIRYLHAKMLSGKENQLALAKTLTQLQECYRILTTTNANTRAVLEHIFLS